MVKLLDENTSIPGVSTVSNIIGFKANGNDTSYLDSNLGVNVGSSEPITIYSSGTLYLTEGQKILFLTRFITPTTNTLDVESINYKRQLINYIVINYIAPQ